MSLWVCGFVGLCLVGVRVCLSFCVFVCLCVDVFEGLGLWVCRFVGFFLFLPRAWRALSTVCHWAVRAEMGHLPHGHRPECQSPWKSLDAPHSSTNVLYAIASA